MTEAKHTPGPWNVSPYGVGFEIDAANGQSIAQAQQIAQTKKPEDHNERKANARLIAAAPELLEALQVAVEAMEQDWHQIDGEWGPIMEEFGDLEGAILAGKAPEIAKARAAIAKATGK